MNQAAPRALSYIQTVLESGPLGGSAEFRALERLSEVPVWINDAAHFTEVSLSSGYKFILIEPRAEMAADRLLALYRVTQSALPTPLILVTDQQRHQVRSALMRAHIGLVRTGSLLFAPQFGLHLKGSPKPSAALNGPLDDHQFQPQEQIFLAAVILHESLRHASSLTQFVAEFVRIHSQPTALNLSPEKILGRVSRAVAHFQRRNLVTIQRAGNEVSIHFSAPEVLWASLCRESQPLATRTYPVFSDAKDLEPYPASALSALSHYSDLLPPKLSTVAMSRAEWASWSKRPVQGGQTAPTANVEVWKTNPRYLELRGTVNPLLLAVNCRRDPDERVRIAIREMLDGLRVSADPLWAL
ncbi:hypothetical protein WDW37_14190 [Bdellovibrionota bacterium FG-1]